MSGNYTDRVKEEEGRREDALWRGKRNNDTLDTEVRRREDDERRRREAEDRQRQAEADQRRREEERRI